MLRGNAYTLHFDVEILKMKLAKAIECTSSIKQKHPILLTEDFKNLDKYLNQIDVGLGQLREKYSSLQHMSELDLDLEDLLNETCQKQNTLCNLDSGNK